MNRRQLEMPAVGREVHVEELVAQARLDQQHRARRVHGVVQEQRGQGLSRTDCHHAEQPLPLVGLPQHLRLDGTQPRLTCEADAAVRHTALRHALRVQVGQVGRGALEGASGQRQDARQLRAHADPAGRQGLPRPRLRVGKTELLHQALRQACHYVYSSRRCSAPYRRRQMSLQK